MNKSKTITIALLISLIFISFSTLAGADGIFGFFEDGGYGTATGRLQFITMGRMRDGNDGFGSPMDGDAHAGSLAATVNYSSPVFQGFSVGAQYVHAFPTYSEGNYDGHKDAAYNLSISEYSKLNNAFIRYDFEHFGLTDTNLTIGRQSLALNFMTHYNIRQKAQAFEAAVFETKPMDDLKVTLGHLHRFSGWTSRDDLNSGSASNKFIDIEMVEDVPYSTKGFQFIETQYTGLPNASLWVYDYFGHDLYNTFGAKADYTFNPESKLQYTLRAHYITQWDVGKFAKETGTRVKSDAVQAGLKFTYGNLTIEPGIFKVTGDGPEDTLRTPFQPGLIGEEPLWEFDLSFEGGSMSYFLESTYGWGKNGLYFLYLQTDHKSNLPPSGTSKEYNLIYSRDLTDRSYLKIKLGNVEYDNHSGVKDGWLDEYRLFIGYRF